MPKTVTGVKFLTCKDCVFFVKHYWIKGYSSAASGCRFNPTIVEVDDYHWCGQFSKRRVDSGYPPTVEIWGNPNEE